MLRLVCALALIAAQVIATSDDDFNDFDDDNSCQTCYDGLKPIFAFLQSEPAHMVQRKAVSEAICQDTNDDVFCREDADALMRDVTKNVVLAPYEAEIVCETMNACDR